MGRNTRIGRTKLELAGGRRGNGGVLAGAAVVAIAAVFGLGLQLGQRRQGRAEPTVAGDRLAVLDRAAEYAPPAPEPAKFEYPDALTKERPPNTLAEVGTRPVAKPVATTVKQVAPRARPLVAAATEQPAGSGPAPVAARADDSTAKAPVPPPARGSWTIQIFSSPKEAEARKVAAKVKGAQVAPADIGGMRWYRVRVGSFPTRGEAQAELPRLNRPDALVVAAR
jgi:septal ring-binding cell division protein DamX